MRRKRLLFCIIVFFIIIVFSTNYFLNTTNEDTGYLTLISPNISKKLDNFNVSNEAKLQSIKYLLNLTNFKYILPNNICHLHNKEFLGIMIVTSYAGHDSLRAAHRQAIPQNKLKEMGLQRVFLLGAISQSEKYINQAQLNNEQKRFGDLLQGNFLDTYRNLSYKHIMGLRWASTQCSQAKFIIKLDDDIIHDIFYLRRYLETLELKEPTLALSSELIVGYLIANKTVERNAANKWCVSKEEYLGTIYPNYVSGWLYITNGATALRLIKESTHEPIFWIDDAWVMGILRRRIDIPIKRINDWFTANPTDFACCVHDLQEYNYECEYFVGANGGNDNLLVEFLHNVEKCYFDECIKRPENKSLSTTCAGNKKKSVLSHGIAEVQQVMLR